MQWISWLFVPGVGHSWSDSDKRVKVEAGPSGRSYLGAEHIPIPLFANTGEFNG